MLVNTTAPAQSSTTLASIIAQLAQIGMERYPDASRKLLRAATVATTRTIAMQGVGDSYWVESESEADQWYLVSLDGQTCTCKAAQHQPGPCKHILAVRLRKAAYRLDRLYCRARDLGEPIPFLLTAKAEQALDGVA